MVKIYPVTFFVLVLCIYDCSIFHDSLEKRREGYPEIWSVLQQLLIFKRIYESFYHHLNIRNSDAKNQQISEHQQWVFGFLNKTRKQRCIEKHMRQPDVGRMLTKKEPNSFCNSSFLPYVEQKKRKCREYGIEDCFMNQIHADKENHPDTAQNYISYCTVSQFIKKQVMNLCYYFSFTKAGTNPYRRKNADKVI